MMSYYEYYRYRLMRALQQAQIAYAFNYMYQKVGADERKREKRRRIEEIRMKFVRDIVRQALAVIEARPELAEDPNLWRTVQDVSDGVSRIERGLGYDPRTKGTLGKIRKALRETVTAENEKSELDVPFEV